jgi:hypothetical protein
MRSPRHPFIYFSFFRGFIFQKNAYQPTLTDNSDTHPVKAIFHKEIDGGREPVIMPMQEENKYMM